VRFRRLYRETGSISPAKFGGYKGYALAAHEELVRQLVAERPDITLAELKALLAKEKVTVGQSSISRFLRHLNLRFKKKPSRPQSHRATIRQTQGAPAQSCRIYSEECRVHRQEPLQGSRLVSRSNLSS
jgi:transposase